MSQTPKINRRQFQSLLGAGALQGLSVLSKTANSNEKMPPNIVLIMADDLGYECINANGSALYRTLFLDLLAHTGMRFTQCHVNPLCTPTRCAIMTGRYNCRNYQAFGTLKQGEKTFAHYLKDAGYATAVAGKWQLGNGTKNGQSPTGAGFDEYCLWNLQVDSFQAKNERYADANLIYLDRETRKPAFNQYKGDYGPDVCKRYLCDFMTDSAKKKKPFFAYYPMILTHNPFVPAPNSKEWKKGNRHKKDNRYFKDMVEYMDRIIGEITAHLEKLGVRKNTLLIFTGDNGTNKLIQSPMQDGSIIQGGKSFLTDAGTHVPLIANWPGTIPHGSVNNDLIDPTDFLPTLLETAGVKLPAASNKKLDGVSFLPQLKGEKGNPREWIYIEYYENRKIFREQEGRFVRNRRWKLYDAGISPFSGLKFYKSGHLYDMKNDPNEKRPYLPDSGDRDARNARQLLEEVMKKYPLPDSM